MDEVLLKAPFKWNFQEKMFPLAAARRLLFCPPSQSYMNAIKMPHIYCRLPRPHCRVKAAAQCDPDDPEAMTNIDGQAQVATKLCVFVALWGTGLMCSANNGG